MADRGAKHGVAGISDNLYSVDHADPRSHLVDRSGLSSDEIQQIGDLMRALSALREAEQSLSAAAQEYMKLNSQDMRALHFLIVAKNCGEVTTPGMLASHLGISAASTTKLLNRLERDGHIVRRVHPADRRALAIEVSAASEAAAMNSMGRQQSRRFHAAARLTSAERDVVIGFLADMTKEISIANADWAEQQEPQG